MKTNNDHDHVTDQTFEAFKQWKDEVKLHAHLFGADAKQEWRQLEKDWNLFESEARSLAPHIMNLAKEGMNEKGLRERINDSIQKIQAGVKRHHAQKS